VPNSKYSLFVEDREETKEERRARRKKSRWGGGEFDKTFIPGMPTILPSNLSKNQEKAYLREFQNYFLWQLLIYPSNNQFVFCKC
jgi:hypothetical protein